MNTNLLKKCIDSLNSERPDLSYVKGILEALMESSGTVGSTSTYILPGQTNVPYINPNMVYASTGTAPQNVDAIDEKIDEVAQLYVGGRVAPIQ